MPERFKTEFYKLYQKKVDSDYDFFTEKIEMADNMHFKYLVCNIDLEIMKCAIGIAKDKSKFTMAQNQASVPRTEIVKLIKCSQGVLAEMFVHFLLMQRYSLDVLRYDLERQTFVYKPDEYDLKIMTEQGLDYEVESRSSNIHHSHIDKFVKEDVIIGPYGNRLKVTDSLADFHFRPIYMPNFIPFVEEFGKIVYNPNMFNGEIVLVITGVATKEDFLKESYEATLGQRGTKYRVVKASVAGDVTIMDKKFSDFFSKY